MFSVMRQLLWVVVKQRSKQLHCALSLTTAAIEAENFRAVRTDLLDLNVRSNELLPQH
jgi:hypothetical protein